MMCLFFGNVPGDMLVVELGLSLVCSKVGLIKVGMVKKTKYVV